MKLAPTVILLALFSVNALAQGQASTKAPAAAQIKAALLAAPADKRDGAAVYGYDNSGNLVLLRKGTNEMICLADDPKQEGLSVSCYHQDLEPFMARGRELRKAGKNAEEIFKAREEEAKSGKLKLPKEPAALYVYTAPAKDFNAATGEAPNGYLRYVVYIPYATSESTGLPLKPNGPAMPWIMHPGTHGAHIMINPPRD
ncbi:hypothetical protein [Pontibacter litorisediminis]|uniref:hypothetical protein n=1 Tax=Pontibacter litorisediminis TaxID=1846260 RepID=UPI0023EB109E|nr:hypothetical protein [Pontibacter litorisediminis]